MIARCGEFYKIITGDLCIDIANAKRNSRGFFCTWNLPGKTYCSGLQAGEYAIAAAFGITIDEFVEWNHDVGSDCSGLWPDCEYCIGLSDDVT
ncbi:hypothetical protein F1880_008623 [Penicillium rolfsii]|nr:hypothetical protein F1880_008623 [Penicillium rolfsii]